MKKKIQYFYHTKHRILHLLALFMWGSSLKTKINKMKFKTNKTNKQFFFSHNGSILSQELFPCNPY